MEVARSQICRSCRNKLSSNPRRTFGTSSRRAIVPAESPAYVDIPASFQPELPYRPQPKGRLPLPRELFPTSRPDKPSQEYLNNVTPDILAKNIPRRDQQSQVFKHKSRASELRKANLRSSLTSLASRKTKEIARMEQISTTKQNQRAALLAQADRASSILTNPSTPQSMHHSSTKSLSTLKSELETAREIHAQKAANLAAHKSAFEANKLDALHTLYMNARHFTTRLDQIEPLIHAQFDTSKVPDPSASYDEQRAPREIMHADFQSSVKRGTSMWNLGAPDSVKDMIADATNRARPGDSLNAISGYGWGRTAAAKLVGSATRGQAMEDARYRRDQERLKRVAEKLSGGRI